MKATLAEQMGWSSTGRVEHLDCAVADIKLYVQMLKYPELTPTTIRHSGWVRAGRMEREEALELERREQLESWEPTMLEPLLADLGLTRQEFEDLARRAVGRE